MGFIIANDASQRRIPALRSVIANWGAINQVVTHFPGESFGRWFPETFDSILLDAPCSMENLRPTPSHPLRETTDSERLRLQEMQIRLLISGLSALKIGGQLVYATCSLAPEENEAVIDQVLKLYPDALIIEDLSSKLPFHAPGLSTYADQIFHPALQNTLRLWPHLTGMSGFFCARLRKTGVIPITPQAPPTRDFSRTQFEATPLNLQSAICEQIWDAYGFDLGEILARYHLELFKRHEGIFLIPQVYLERFQTLPFEWIGMQIGQWIAGNFHPSLEFASRFGHLFIRGKAQLDDSQLSQWIDQRDIRNPKIDLPPQGQYLLVEDKSGRNLGVGKLLSKRLRNLLPRS
jgi:16S rRNA (cytosine1407-C5)-methyltransferase